MIIAHGRLLADGTPTELAARSRFHGALTLDVTPPEEAAAIVSALPEVARVEPREGGRGLTVFPKDGAVLLPRLGKLIDEHQWTVQGLYQESGRLDEVFRSITGGAEA
jgi:ABC-2 type transport system ATP-binding protein